MDRKYFTEIGKYDPGLNVWGGENLEISFRVFVNYVCVYVLVCSRIHSLYQPGGQCTSPKVQKQKVTLTAVKPKMIDYEAISGYEAEIGIKVED